MTDRARLALIIALVALAMTIAIPLVSYVGFRMPNLSMEPTVKQNAWLIVNRFSSANVTRGALAFHFRDSKTEGRILVLKRIVGLPGETVVIENAQASIIGNPWIDTYGHFEDRTKIPVPDLLHDHYQIHLGADEVFVLGDNRWRSVDSRAYGPVKISEFKYWDPWVMK